MPDIICTGATYIILLGYRQEMWILSTSNGKKILNYFKVRNTELCTAKVRLKRSSLLVSKGKVIVLSVPRNTLL